MKLNFVYGAGLALLGSSAMTAACDHKSPTTPTNDTTPTFTATLRPADEVPSVTGTESTGTGTVTITMNVTKDTAGNITSAMATFAVNLNGFPAGTPVNMAHIHQAAVGQNGDVVVSTTISPGDVTMNNGGGTFTRSGVAVTPDVAIQLLSNPAGFYFNIHSTLNPGGAARGQLTRVK
jgi:hypothetical protein